MLLLKAKLIDAIDRNTGKQSNGAAAKYIGSTLLLNFYDKVNNIFAYCTSGEGSGFISSDLKYLAELDCGIIAVTWNTVYIFEEI